MGGGETPTKLLIKPIYQLTHLFCLILGRDWHALVGNVDFLLLAKRSHWMEERDLILTLKPGC